MLLGLLGAAVSARSKEVVATCELRRRSSLFSYAAALREAASVEGPVGQRPLVAFVLSMLGDFDGAIAMYDAGNPGRLFAEPELSQDTPEDALHAILREAAKHQIVIINEAHHVPMHRAFSMRLAVELRNVGFEYLACEAFKCASEPRNGIVNEDSGAYLQDPVFAEFMRSAVRDGWQLVAYDVDLDRSVQGGERVRQRALEQARNILEKVLVPYPNARLMIHVGYGHVIKTRQPLGQSGDSMFWMAGALKELSGIDVLTIDQAWTHAHPDPAHEVAGFRKAVALHGGKGPFVLRRRDGSIRLLQIPSGAVDLQIIHPPYASIAGRPIWLMEWAEREPLSIPDAWLPLCGKRIIYAMHADHPANAVPADIVLLESGKVAPNLMLPAGRFKFEFEDL